MPSVRCSGPLLALLFLPLWLTACGGGDEAPPGSNPSPLPPGTVGAAGGTVSGPSGSQVVIPAGALNQNVVINIASSSTGAPALPAGHVAVGQTFAFTPHGTQFAVPATVTIPFDPAQVPAGETPVMLKTNAAQTGWEEVSGVTLSGSSATAAISGFSFILMSRVPPPIGQVGTPKRWWSFGGINLDFNTLRIEGTLPVVRGGPWGPVAPEGPLLEDTVFGTLPFIPAGGDANADGEIFSTADGKTYWLEAEAPSTEILAQDPERTFLGGESVLRMRQSYRKNAENATLELHITDARMMLLDNNPAVTQADRCPWALSQLNTLADCQDFLIGSLDVQVKVIQGFQDDGKTERDAYDTLYGGVSYLHSSGLDIAFDGVYLDATNIQRVDSQGRPVLVRNLWLEADFEEVQEGSMHILRLREPLHVPVDLSKVDECVNSMNSAECPEFTLDVQVRVAATNRRGGESYAFARFRDPVNTGGLVIESTGLTETNRPVLGDDYGITAQIAPACEDGDDPEAGTLQFSAADYRIMEFGATRPAILVTRTGGSEGELVATVTTRNGTAVAGTHYSSVSQLVVFHDGDAVPRLITIPTLNNNTNDGNVTLEVVLTTQPGCATLGTPNVATVTLIDDEEPPYVNDNPSGSLDTTFDTDGKVNTAPFGGIESRMVMQPDGKFVMVGGTFTDFIAARFNNDGSPDNGFGTLGRIGIDISGGVLQERARAVALQADGKIVLAGEGTVASNNDFAVALLRLNADGTPDTTFSGDGEVLEVGIPGRAFAVAIQPDGKIVVAGDIPLASENSPIQGEMFVARFNADGALDTSFGDAGVSIHDVTTGQDAARNLLLLPDGSMIAAGDPITTQNIPPTGVLKLDANGQLMTSFGTNGKISIDTARVGRGLALQTDGKLLLAGRTLGSPGEFALMRLDADGSIDSTFGTSGLVTTDISGSTSGEGDQALAVALRPDGRIYVAGHAGSINRNMALARYTNTGALDTTFAGTGFVTVDFNALSDGAESLVLQSDGRIVLGGFATPTSNDGYGLARINP